jgi:hypothetical protein
VRRSVNFDEAEYFGSDEKGMVKVGYDVSESKGSALRYAILTSSFWLRSFGGSGSVE